jgi:4'-phosphopantetheinyl transferase
MESDEILIWYIETESIQNTALLSRFFEWLSPEERAQHRRFRFDRHKHTYLVSHALVRSALSLITQVEPAKFSFKTNAYGKPFIATPIQHQALHFNLSHTDGLAAVAISRQSEVGVDVESHNRQILTQSLVKQFFAPEECQAVAQANEQERSTKMLEFWTLKESYIKAVGMGLSIPLDSFAFKLASATQSACLLRLDSETEELEAWRFWQGRPTENHLMALSFKPNHANPIQVVARQADWLARA